MTDTITLTKSQYEDIMKRIETLERALFVVVKKLKSEPSYGSSEWWEQSDKTAVHEVSKGLYKTTKTKKELQGFLDSLK